MLIGDIMFMLCDVRIVILHPKVFIGFHIKSLFHKVWIATMS